MDNQKSIDKKIVGLVQSVETEIPPVVDKQLQETAEAIRPLHRTRIKRVPLFMGILSTAAAALFAILFLFPLSPDKPEPQITEILTECEIIDKNIKIIFMRYNLSKKRFF